MPPEIYTKMSVLGLPWWRSGWESACQCRGHRFMPWSRNIPHAAEQLGPWATTTEPARLEPVLRNKRGRDSERPTHHDEEWSPLAATRESPHTETKTQHSQKLKKNKKNKNVSTDVPWAKNQVFVEKTIQKAISQICYFNWHKLLGISTPFQSFYYQFDKN